MTVDHSRAPVLEALDAYRRKGHLSFTPPGHKQARGADPEVRRILGDAVVPSPAGLRMEQALLPRDAFFGPAGAVPVAEAAGRIAAEMITPYPPGIPAVLPGERLTEPVPAYLRSGLDAGMHLPDPTDPTLETVRVLDEGARQPGK